MKRDMDQATKQFPATPVEAEDAIRRRAYESYEQRGINCDPAELSTKPRTDLTNISPLNQRE